MKNGLIFLGTSLMLAIVAPALCQTADSTVQKRPARLSLSGPRVGITVITGADAGTPKTNWMPGRS